MSERDPEWEPAFGTPQAVSNPGGLLQPDIDQPAENDRVAQLPDFENDELRGANETGGGVLSQGGTARETGQASGTDRPAREDLGAPLAAASVLPIPLVSGEEPKDERG